MLFRNRASKRSELHKRLKINHQAHELVCDSGNIKITGPSRHRDGSPACILESMCESGTVYNPASDFIEASEKHLYGSFTSCSKGIIPIENLKNVKIAQTRKSCGRGGTQMKVVSMFSPSQNNRYQSNEQSSKEDTPD